MEFFRDILEDSNQSSDQRAKSKDSSSYSAPEGRFNPESSSSSMSIDSPMNVISKLKSRIKRSERNQPPHTQPYPEASQLDTALKKFIDDPIAVHRMINPKKECPSIRWCQLHPMGECTRPNLAPCIQERPLVHGGECFF